MKGLVAAGLAVGLAVAVIGTAILASAASLVGVGSGDPAASSAATAQIPPSMLTLYQQAAASCPGLSWTILAAIGTMESDNGQSNLPGVHSGANAAGAEGPMQFEPATFAEYDEPIPPGGAIPPNPYDPTDAVYCGGPAPLCQRWGRWGRRVRRGLRLQPLCRLCERSAGVSPDLRRRRNSFSPGCCDCWCSRCLVGVISDRHAVCLGWRDAGGRFRLLGAGTGRLRRGGRGPSPGGPGPVRHNAEARRRGGIGAG